MAVVWDEIVARLRHHAPAEAAWLRPPASVETISQVEVAVGRPI